MMMSKSFVDGNYSKDSSVSHSKKEVHPRLNFNEGSYVKSYFFLSFSLVKVL